MLHAPNAAANLREIYAAGRGAAVVPVLLFRQSVAQAAPDLVELAGRLTECHVLPDTADPAAVAGLGLTAVTTFHDQELEAADVLDRGPCPERHPDAENVWDKLVQRRRFREAGVGRVVAVAVDAPADLGAAVRTVSFPCVLKPRRSAGGRGVAFLDGPDDVEHQLRHRARWEGLLLESRVSTTGHPSGAPWLGEMLSVETVSVGRQRIHLGVLDKFPVAVVRRGGDDGGDAVSVQGEFYPSRLDEERLRAARELTGRALDALGVRDRLTHTELVLTPYGMEVVEVNGRLAGHTARLFRLAGGPDLIRTALRVAAGTLDDVPVTPADGVAVGMFPAFADRSGPVRSRGERAALRDVPGVAAVEHLAVPGQDKAALQFQVANLTIHAADPAGADAAVDAVLARLAAMYAADGFTPRLLAPAGSPVPR